MEKVVLDLVSVPMLLVPLFSITAAHSFVYKLEDRQQAHYRLQFRIQMVNR